ncbi:hypothetical protein [Paenibacillus pabuli]|uniref:hypothetical protein n=1 Tax=Paenibacillus pabuli TaxID=1472 RepID=UPI001FFE9C24|nr:hypothetical protein [Paenibacillus pabuli]UPK45766.1 hypothetical protein KET34_10070 [Paenibacillus pabuli]
MQQAELYQLLESIGLPLAYGEFKSTPELPAPDPPFIVYQFGYSGDLMADNRNYLKISNFQIELYTDIKDLAAEGLVEDVLEVAELPYSKTEITLDSEAMYQIIYEIQLIGG